MTDRRAHRKVVTTKLNTEQPRIEPNLEQQILRVQCRQHICLKAAASRTLKFTKLGSVLCPSACLYLCRSVHLYLCLSYRPSVCLSVCPSVRLSVHLPVRSHSMVTYNSLLAESLSFLRAFVSLLGDNEVFRYTFISYYL